MVYFGTCFQKLKITLQGTLPSSESLWIPNNGKEMLKNKIPLDPQELFQFDCT